MASCEVGDPAAAAVYAAAVSECAARNAEHDYLCRVLPPYVTPGRRPWGHFLDARTLVPGDRDMGIHIRARPPLQPMYVGIFQAQNDTGILHVSDDIFSTPGCCASGTTRHTLHELLSSDARIRARFGWRRADYEATRQCHDDASSRPLCANPNYFNTAAITFAVGVTMSEDATGDAAHSSGIAVDMSNGYLYIRGTLSAELRPVDSGYEGSWCAPHGHDAIVFRLVEYDPAPDGEGSVTVSVVTGGHMFVARACELLALPAVDAHAAVWRGFVHLNSTTIWVTDARDR